MSDLEESQELTSFPVVFTWFSWKKTSKPGQCSGSQARIACRNIVWTAEQGLLSIMLDLSSISYLIRTKTGICIL